MKIDYSDRSEVHEGSEDLYLRSRLSFYRDACYSCHYKGCNRESDITIGDFVGMKELLRKEYDGYGTTLSMVHTSKGMELLKNCGDELFRINIADELKETVKQNNTMLAKRMQRKPQHYYMRAIYKNSSIERLFYEDKFWDEFHARESMLRIYFNEIKRNELLVKAERYVQYHLWIDDDPGVHGEIFIYGAGKIGRCLTKCTHDIEGFIDGNANLSSCKGIKVYHLGTDEIRKVLKSGKGATVIVTPVWDYESIEEKLKWEFPEISIVSVKELVGNIWI